MSAICLDTLLARIYRHYPRGVDGDDPAYLRTEEFRRLQCVLRVCAENVGVTLPSLPASDRVPIDVSVREVLDRLSRWRAFKQALAQDFPDTLIWDQSPPWHEPCYRCDVPQQGYAMGSEGFDPVVCVLSALAPVYVLFTFVEQTRESSEDEELDPRPPIHYSGFAERYRERETRMAARIEAMFSFHRLTEDTLSVPVPDVMPHGSNLLMGQATLMDCLFTSHR